MKIVIVNSFYPPWRGGAETYVANLARELALRKNRVTVICADAYHQPVPVDGVGVTVRRHFPLMRLYGTPIMPGLIQDLLSTDTDIFHANFPSPFIALTVALASRSRGVPAVLTWHNDLPPVTLLARAMVEVHDRLVLPHYIQHYRKVIATSEQYRGSSPILSALGDRVEVIMNGVDCAKFNPRIAPAPISARFGLAEEFKILFVGALTKWHGYKGLTVLLRAVSLCRRRLPKVCLLVVGDGDLRQRYESLAKCLKISKQVRFLGDVSEQDLPSFYTASDVLCLPSINRSEGFGLTLLEANASGIPCLASNIGGIPGVIANGYNGFLVPPNDPQALAHAILRLARQTSVRLKMGENGRRFALENDWSLVARNTERVYMLSRQLPR